MVCLGISKLTGRRWLSLELSCPTASHCCQHDMRTGEIVSACPGGYWSCLTGQEYDCVCGICDLVLPACLSTNSTNGACCSGSDRDRVPASFFSNRGRSAVRLAL